VSLLAVALIAVHIAVVAQLAVWIKPFMPVEALPFRAGVLAQLRSAIPIDLLTVVLLLFGGSSLGANHRARRLELRESRLEVELARAQLDALRLEIHPHFLFNTLNSIAALIRIKDNGGALKMLLDLSELMRATIDGPREHLVALSAEIDFVRRYVDLQRIRFEDRLIVEYEIGEGCLGIAVPTLLLQPFVENALRHGAARQAQRCRLRIGASTDAGRLRLWVVDDGVGLPPGFNLDRDAGTGLRNTRSRVAQIYGPLATLNVRAGTSGGTEVEIVLPASPLRPQVKATA
jgi:LytS/YehU family sensor histidine kinase